MLLALLVICAWLRPPAVAPLEEGRRLIDAIGWAAVLPQMLAALGVVFAAAGVGGIVGDTTRAAIPDGNVFLTVVVYGLGMALFTIIMGNAFAAFPVMATAIGVPLLIQTYHGDPAVIGAIGMLAGFCGTLMTPMAANFNIVPAALLELKDRNGVIKAQIGTAHPPAVREHPADLLPGLLAPPRDGEGDRDAKRRGGGGRALMPVTGPLHHAAHGPPPRPGEDLIRRSPCRITSPPKPPTASPRSRLAMSPANIRTSSIRCWRGRRICSRRARCIRSSSAASTGTAACTATGCC